MTIVLGSACVFGLVGGARPTGGLTSGRRIRIAIPSAAAQLLALWMSLQPLVASR